MAIKIIWTNKAEKTFDDIIEYLQNQWSEKSAIKFVRKANEIINSISLNPYTFQKSNKENIRLAVIMKHTSLYYEIIESKIYLLIFWDNRQNPQKISKYLN